MHAQMHASLIALRDYTVLKYSVFNNDRRPVIKFYNLYFLQVSLSSDLLLRVKECTYNHVNNQKSLEWIPLHYYTVSITRSM